MSLFSKCCQFLCILRFFLNDSYLLLVGWVLWHINLCRLFNAKSIFKKTVLFQTIIFQANQFSQAVKIQLIQFNISTDFAYTQLKVKTVLY